MRNYLKVDYELLERMDLDVYEKLIYAIVLSYKDSEKKCYTTNSQFSILLSVDERTIKRKVKSLVQKKLITTEYMLHKKRIISPFIKDIVSPIKDIVSPPSNIIKNKGKTGRVFATTAATTAAIISGPVENF